MWWSRAPESNAERAEEIARLTKQRDHLLDRVPEAFVVQRSVALCFFGLVVILIGDQILFHRARYNFAASVVLALFAVLFLGVMHNGWTNRPPIWGRWAMSGMLGYEGDSPQDLQREIDRLRAQMDESEQHLNNSDME